MNVCIIVCTNGQYCSPLSQVENPISFILCTLEPGLPKNKKNRKSIVNNINNSNNNNNNNNNCESNNNNKNKVVISIIINVIIGRKLNNNK